MEIEFKVDEGAVNDRGVVAKSNPAMAALTATSSTNGGNVAGMEVDVPDDNSAPCLQTG
jgi:hypothetical protein